MRNVDINAATTKVMMERFGDEILLTILRVEGNRSDQYFRHLARLLDPGAT
jgi:hypothetical protein